MKTSLTLLPHRLVLVHGPTQIELFAGGSRVDFRVNGEEGWTVSDHGLGEMVSRRTGAPELYEPVKSAYKALERGDFEEAHELLTPAVVSPSA